MKRTECSASPASCDAAFISACTGRGGRGLMRNGRKVPEIGRSSRFRATGTGQRRSAQRRSAQRRSAQRVLGKAPVERLPGYAQKLGGPRQNAAGLLERLHDGPALQRLKIKIRVLDSRNRIAVP